MHFGQKFQSAVVIQKIIKRSKNPFKVGFYTILRLYHTQLKLIVFTYLLMETPKQLMPKLLLQVSARELQNSMDKNPCVGVSVVYMPKSCIRHHYHGVSAF